MDIVENATKIKNKEKKMGDDETFCKEQTSQKELEKFGDSSVPEYFRDYHNGYVEEVTLEYARLDNKISALETQNKEINAELKQQRFNNKHNLSIDQTVCDRILEMENQISELTERLERSIECSNEASKIHKTVLKKNALMKEALELIAFLDEPLADTIGYWEGLSNDRFTETLCTDTFVAREVLAKVSDLTNNN